MRSIKKILILMGCLWMINGNAANITVRSTSTADINVAIRQANTTPGPDRIIFDISGNGFRGRVTATETITDLLIIDGTTLSGYQKYFPVIEFVLPSRNVTKALTLKGLIYNTGYLPDGATVSPNAIPSNIIFQDCNIFNSTGSGSDRQILVKNVSNVTFLGCVFSLSLFTDNVFENSYVYERISIIKSNNIVLGGTGAEEANVIVGFRRKGVFLYRANNVQFNSNYIGVLPKSLAANHTIEAINTASYSATNGQDGIYISQSSNIFVGGSANQSTIIGNMNTNGIYMINSSFITIKNNKIGVFEDGITWISNMNGITSAGELYTSAGNPQPQGFDSPDTLTNQYAKYCKNIRILDNIISGNQINGVQLGNADSVWISGNKIGTDVSGKIDRGNGWGTYPQTDEMGDGINLYRCMRVHIGGTAVESGYPIFYPGNIIGYNKNGISIWQSQKIYIEANKIGINPFFNVAIPNKRNGISLLDQSENVRIGPAQYVFDDIYSSTRNYIAGNGGNGISIYSSYSKNNWISYNIIGSSSIANGANKGYGVLLTYADNNLVGSREDDNNKYGNRFENNTLGHIGNYYGHNNLFQLNIFSPRINEPNFKFINLFFDEGGTGGNYSSRAPTITSVIEGPNSTITVSGTSYKQSELIEVYQVSGSTFPVKRTVSNGGAWQVSLSSTDGGYISSILSGYSEGKFVALASCSDYCGDVFNPNSLLYHNTSEFSDPKTIKINKFECEGCVESFSPLPGAKYVLSAWVKEDASTSGNKDSYDKVGIKISFNGGSLQSNTYLAKGKIVDTWQRIEEEFEIPVEAKDITISLVNEGTANAFYDDIRIFPIEGEMRSFVYDPLLQKLVAELDEKNYATLYEYDKEGILVRVKKETERGVYTIKETRSHQADK